LYLVDEQSTHPGGNDLKSGTKTAAGFDRNDPTSWNYQYDPIGNLIKDVNEGIDLISWTVTGKVSEVVFDPAKQNYNLAFRYDPMGNRIAKIQKPHNSLANCTTWTVTWYSRDAQGNVLAVYKKPENSTAFSATEFNIYGSSRLGMVTQPEALPETPTVPVTHSQTLGLKVYEFSNHLGNVLTTFSDRKIAIEATPGYVAYYTAEILTSTDYYPFGFQMSGRVYEGDGYRYGFGGQEVDNEIIGTGNSISYYFRKYNPRIARFLSRDPLSGNFPWWSPYQYAGNRPIDGIDLEGAEYVTYIVRVSEDLSSAAIIQVLDYRNQVEFNYEKYSISFGPEGRGIKYTYQYQNGAGEVTKTEDIWEQEQGGSFSISAFGTHGMFYGQGAKTVIGPLFEDVSIFHSEGGAFNTYDWNITPVDMVDAIARLHDLDQDIKGTFCWLEDNRTLEGDNAAIKAWSKYIAVVRVLQILGLEFTDPITQRHASKEAINAAQNGIMFFSILVRYKEWKIKEMEKQDLDPNNPQDMERISIDDYGAKWWQFRKKHERAILKAAKDSGGSTEDE
jgi:RHS repeat-associated protein